MILIQLSFFFLLSWYGAIFIRYLELVCNYQKKKKSRKTPKMSKNI